MAVEPSGTAPGQLAALLSQHRLRITLVGLLGLLVGLSAGLVTASYTASATVLITPLNGNPYSPLGRGDDLVNLGTEAQLVDTDAVAKMARARLRSGDVAQLRAHVSVQNPSNTQVLNISFSGKSREAARAGAQAFADSYLDYRRQRAQNILDGKLKKLQEQSQRVQEELQATNAKLPMATGAQRTFLSQRVTAYTNQLSIIDEQSNDIAGTTVNPGQVINPALPPSEIQRFTGLLPSGFGGLVAGLLAGTGIVMLGERLERRITNAKAVERLGLRVLSVVPPCDDQTKALAFVDAPRSDVGDAYRRLRAATVAALPQSSATIVVTSATPSKTAMLTSSNLALTLSYAGSATIMIDAGTSGVDSADLFGLRSPKGLSDTLLDGVDPATLLVHGATQLRLLPRGSRAEESAHRFSGPRMRDAVTVLRDRADVLIINAPSLHDPDAQALCTLADAVVLVVLLDVTTRDEVIQARAEAERAGKTIIGAVVESVEMDHFPSADTRHKGGRRREPKPTRSRHGAPASFGSPAGPVVWDDTAERSAGERTTHHPTEPGA